MSSSTSCLAVIAAASLTFQPSLAADSGIPKNCRARIDAEIPGWRLSPPPDDLAAEAKREKLETNRLRADLDDDGILDTAVLLVAPGKEASTHCIAICLDRKTQPELHLIREPYCWDGIAVAPKGRKAHDYRTDKTFDYPTNGVHAYCYEKAGGTYLYRSGRFELVVDSD